MAQLTPIDPADLALMGRILELRAALSDALEGLRELQADAASFYGRRQGDRYIKDATAALEASRDTRKESTK